MDVRSVIPILKLANADGSLALPVQELCKSPRAGPYVAWSFSFEEPNQ